MNNVTSFLRQHLKQILIVFLAGFLVLTATACNPPSTRVTGEGSYNEKVGQTKDLYDTVQKPVGGMNNFNDTETDAEQSSGRAKRLIEGSKQNLKNRARSPQDLVDNVKQNPPTDQAKKTVDRVGNQLEKLGEDVSEGTKRGTRNLKENLQNAGQAAQDTAADASRDAKETGRSLGSQAKRSLDSAKDSGRDAASAVKRNVKDLADDADSAVRGGKTEVYTGADNAYKAVRESGR